MHREQIGILLIGQTPRPDLTAPLEALAQTHALVVRGALDPLTQADLPDPAGSAYPLVTRLRDGVLVTVDEGFLAPLLQTTLDDVERQGVIASLLLCAGPFAGLTSTRPLIRPFPLAAQTLHSLGLARLGVVVPTDAQREPATRKWKDAGFNPVLWSMEAKPPDLSPERWLATQCARQLGLAALVFDYVGYPLGTIQRVRAQVRLPVLDLGHFAVATLEALLSTQR